MKYLIRLLAALSLLVAVGIAVAAQLLVRYYATLPSTLLPSNMSSPRFFDCKTVCPPVFWSAWSECSRRCGGGEQWQKALFQAVCTGWDEEGHTSHCQQVKVKRRLCNRQPCSVSAEEYGGPDGLPPLPPNPLNPPILVDTTDQSCNLWVNEYKKTFTAITTGQRSPSYLVYSTAGADYPGGLAGRIKGITTVFILAVLLDRAFVLDWDDSPRLTDYLIPNAIDWLTALQHVQLPPVAAFHDIGSWRAVAKEGRNDTWYRTMNFRKLLTQPVEVIRAPVYDLTHALMSNKHMMQKAYALQLDGTRCHLCCTWTALFKFNADFEQEMNKSLERLGAAFTRLIALQLRSEVIPDREETKAFINCAAKAARNFSSAHFSIAANNKLALHLIREQSGLENMFVQVEEGLEGLVHIHMGTKRLPPHDKEKAARLQRVSFQHFYLLLNAAVLVRGVGHMASLGVVADALRRHNSTRLYSYVVNSKNCTLVAPGKQTVLI